MNPVDNYFPVEQVNADWIFTSEVMGSKVKFWYRTSPTSTPWLFKFPQANTGQHWAEKIAAEVAALLQLPHARVELAEWCGLLGSATESFTEAGVGLFHGNQVLAGQVVDYDRDKRFRQANHTLANILSALDGTFATGESALAAKQTFASYLILDAIISSTDRHHENWGVLVDTRPQGWNDILAPTFDHASSLGRELLDDGRKKCRKRILNEATIGP
jgi:hypothetical protein